jgi:hypothetical protein
LFRYKNIAGEDKEAASFAKKNNTMIVPGNLTELSDIVSAMANFQYARADRGDTGKPEIYPGVETRRKTG